MKKACRLLLTWLISEQPKAHPQGLKLLSAARLDLLAKGVLGVQHARKALLLRHILLPVRPVRDRKLVLVLLVCDLAQVHLQRDFVSKEVVLTEVSAAARVTLQTAPGLTHA